MGKVEEFLDSLNVESDDPRFFRRAFIALSRMQKKKYLGKDGYLAVIAEEYGYLSHRLDQSKFQESASVRNVLKTRKLAALIIDDEGEINLNVLSKIILALKQQLYILGPDRQFDGVRNEHLLRTLIRLMEDKDLQIKLRQISKPYSHKIADQIIRDTLQLSPNHPVTDAETKRAALAAWLCFLRQNVGSCFATAPAIVIQQEMPEQLLKDFNDLLSTGRLKRVVGGIEHAVPLSLSWGAGDLRKPLVIDALDKQTLHSLTLSPGILASLEEVGLIDQSQALKVRIEQSKAKIQEVFDEMGKEKHYLVISAEDILQKILMKHFQISSQDLIDFENRAKAMLQTSLILHPQVQASGVRGKADAVSKYLTQFEIAKNAFKALADNALLKTWEFTLASFAETKPAFTRWNMYASLGFNSEELGGIGDVLYQEIKARLDSANQKVASLQQDYEIAYSQLTFVEGRLRNASTEKEIQWLKVDYQSRRNEFKTLEEMRDKEHYKARRFANLLNDLLESYDKLFPRYFQEVYDADMHEVTTGPYDDSPAGFRLLYKHGRDNTSLWTLIHTPQEFIEALSSFFIATETEILGDTQYQGLESDIGEMVTRIVSHIKTDQFMESAFYRMAKAHNTLAIKNPLMHLDKIDKKPWAYTSGGSMHNLMSSYFRLEGKPTEQGRWVENPMELLVFLVDTVKQMPFKLSEEYLYSKDKSLLMHSPTHAFMFKPSLPLFKKAVLNESFSYTWIRDHFVRPSERFVEYHFLDEEMMQFLIKKLLLFVPINFRPRFQDVFSKISGKKNSPEFRRYLVETMEKDPGLRKGGEIILQEDVIDSLLYVWLPLTSRIELGNRCEKILEAIFEQNEEKKMEVNAMLISILSKYHHQIFVTAKDLREICQLAVSLIWEATSVPTDYAASILQIAQNLGFAMPTPILFADTNWVKEYFAFVVNPGTGILDFWRMDHLGSEGVPLSAWKMWLNGSNKERTWGVFTKPFEYKSG